MLRNFLLRYSENMIDSLVNLAKRNAFVAALYKIFVQNFIIDRKLPYIINIETTNACNLRCSMCPRKQSRRKVGFMDFKLFKKIVDESNRCGSRIFTLHKDGEPLLHPKIIDMIRYIKFKNKNNSIYLTTNGHFLDERKARKIIELGVDKLNISIGAATIETYKKIRGSKNLEKVENNVKKVIELKRLMKSRKPQVVVQIIKMQETLDEIGIFKNKWEIEGAKVSVWNFLNWGGAMKDKAIKKMKRRYPCYSLWMAPVINWDGRVSVCCIDWRCNEIVGDIKKESLSAVWEGEKLKKYRKLHLQGLYEKIKLCSYCNSWQDYPDFFFSWQKMNKIKMHPAGGYLYEGKI